MNYHLFFKSYELTQVIELPYYNQRIEEIINELMREFYQFEYGVEFVIYGQVVTETEDYESSKLTLDELLVEIEEQLKYIYTDDEKEYYHILMDELRGIVEENIKNY